MKVTAEHYSSQREFYDYRDVLIREGRRFDSVSLGFLSYTQLFLASSGNAREAMCDPILVRDERRLRRARFVSLEPEALSECELFLRVQGMHEDVMAERKAHAAPRWRHLTARQKVWAKLHCLFVHVDHPHVRLYETIGLLEVASQSSDLPPEIAAQYGSKLKGLAGLYPNRLADTTFRDYVEEIRDEVREFLTEPERSICLKEEIRDYQCTSDCFRVLL